MRTISSEVTIFLVDNLKHYVLAEINKCKIIVCELDFNKYENKKNIQLV